MVVSSITLTPGPAPTSSLSIAGRAGHAFTPHAMIEGFACHARGVELAACGPSRVHARVRSKRVHDVHLRADRGKLAVACTCPARSLGLDVCKHVWAALLEVDRNDGLTDLRGSRGPLVVEPAPSPPSGTHPADAAAPKDVRPPPKQAKAKTSAPTTPDPAKTSRPRSLAKTMGVTKENGKDSEKENERAPSAKASPAKSEAPRASKKAGAKARESAGERVAAPAKGRPASRRKR